MTGKKIAVIALAVAIVFVCALTVAFLMMPGLSYAMLGVGQPAYGSGYGRGMMGGYASPDHNLFYLLCLQVVFLNYPGEKRQGRLRTLADWPCLILHCLGYPPFPP